MTATKLRRRSPPTTLERLQEYADFIADLGDSWEDDQGDVDVDAEVRFDHRPVDTEEFSIRVEDI